MTDIVVSVSDSLDPQGIANVLQMVTECTDADGVSPFSEHVLLSVRHADGDGIKHIIAWRNGNVAGYAHLDLSQPLSGPSAELAVRPFDRRHGIGTLLLSVLMSESRPGALQLWAHGEEAGVGLLAHTFGFEKVRTLWQMRRPLLTRIDTPKWPDNITIRPFNPEIDISAWLACNARAFTDHPEQGRWQERDLCARMAEPWFDPNGFLIAATTENRIAGFHWTKIHSPTDHNAHLNEPLGEVYIVGVDPDFQGSGLGKALVLEGLRHLRGEGLTTAMLYVDGEDERAISLYSSLGFVHWDSDTLYRDPLMPPASN